MGQAAPKRGGYILLLNTSNPQSKLEKEGASLPVVTAVDSLNEGGQFSSIDLFLSKVDNVHGNIVLLQFLSEFNKSGLVFSKRTGNKDDNALSLILILSVLQNELFCSYMVC